MKFLIPGFLFLIVVGCATTLHFVTEVDSLARADSVGNRYVLFHVLLTGNDNVDVDGLELAFYKAQTVRALNTSGYQESPIEEADFAIFVRYGMGAPRTGSYSVPIFGRTGYKTTGATTLGILPTIGNMSTINSTTTVDSEPTFGSVGTAKRSRTVYLRHLILTAYDLSSNKDGKYDEAWRTTVTSTGSSGDLRRVFPLLLASGASHFGKATDQQEIYNLTELHPLVLQIKGQVAD